MADEDLRVREPQRWNFLASQGALEVMYVSDSVTQLSPIPEEHNFFTQLYKEYSLNVKLIKLIL